MGCFQLIKVSIICIFVVFLKLYIIYLSKKQDDRKIPVKTKANFNKITKTTIFKHKSKSVNVRCMRLWKRLSVSQILNMET